MYCYTIWSNARCEPLDDLLKLQKRATRLLLDQSIEIPFVGLFRALNWIPVHGLIKMRKVLLVFNYLRSSTPLEIRNLFTFCEDAHSVSTRASVTDLKLSSLRSELGKSKLFYSRAMLFNSLPTDLNIINNYILPSFKRRIKSFFLELKFMLIIFVNSHVFVVNTLWFVLVIILCPSDLLLSVKYVYVFCVYYNINLQYSITHK